MTSIGITLMTTDRGMHPVELAGEVEQRGFDALYLPEHSHIPTSRRTPWPGARPGHEELPDYYARLLDQVVALSMAAAVTERIELGTAVTLVAQHDPIWMAKQWATLDHLSGGRVVLGVGFGWNREEGHTHGVDWSTRRQLVEEKVAVMRSLWTNEVADFTGERVTLEPSWAWPKPARAGGPPLLLGGGWGPVLFDHIARWGDGWMPISGRAGLGDRLVRLRQRWADAGRRPDDLQIAVMGASENPDDIRVFIDEGVQRLALTVWSEDRDEILRTLDRFAAVAAAVRP